MPTFSRESQQILNSCDQRLQEICQEVVKTYDIRILEGYRSYDRQEELFRQNKTTKRGGQSKHNIFPSAAVDIAPYPIDWENLKRFFLMAGFMFQAAASLGYTIRWGGDWDGDWEHIDQKFHDLPHFEIVDL